MFTLAQSPTYWWPVKFSLPSATGATQAVHTFDVEFKRFSVTDGDALGARVAAEKLTDAQIAAELVVGWNGVNDANGLEVAFSQAALKRALDLPNVASAIVSAFFASNARAAEKNS